MQRARDRERERARERWTVMHTDRSDVATRTKLCCCNFELCANSVKNKSSDQIKLSFICSSIADGRERELTPEFRIWNTSAWSSKQKSPHVISYGQGQSMNG